MNHILPACEGILSPMRAASDRFARAFFSTALIARIFRWVVEAVSMMFILTDGSGVRTEREICVRLDQAGGGAQAARMKTATGFKRKTHWVVRAHTARWVEERNWLRKK